MIRALAVLLLAGIGGAAGADPVCEDITHREKSFTVCHVDLAAHRLRLFLKREDGGPFGHFGAINRALAEDGLQLSFAMNAGMYHLDRSPVGLYVADGAEEQRLVTSAGPGNFGLLPNGVFCVGDGRAEVIETLRFETEAPNCTHATQSGPMLVIDGALHPRFLPNSTSRYVRNGVGTSADGQRAVFAISNEVVTFHEFATLYRDVLGLPNALYFDGNVSRLFARSINRNDSGFALGPIIGVVETLD